MLLIVSRDLAYNKLTEAPPVITKYKLLQTLYVSQRPNSFDDESAFDPFSHTICSCSALHCRAFLPTLPRHLSGNLISEFKKEFALPTLQTLYVVCALGL